MPELSTATDYAARDADIAISSYTTVLRRPRVPHELFATYWRDVHGPLCSRVPGLGWYVQHHLDRQQDAHLWPALDGIAPFPDYELDGGVEIGFYSAADQDQFNEACSILFTDEQNMFAATVAYALPTGSTTLVDRVADPAPNEDDGLDRIHLHLGAAPDQTDAAFHDRIHRLATALAAEEAVLKLRLHLPDTYDNADPAPPAPNVAHDVPDERRRIAILDLAFASPLTRRQFYATPPIRRRRRGPERPHRPHHRLRRQRRLHLRPRQTTDRCRPPRQPPRPTHHPTRRSQPSQRRSPPSPPDQPPQTHLTTPSACRRFL